MNKNDVSLILTNCFKEEGKCAFLHFQDGSEMLIQKLPQFRSTVFIIEGEYNFNDTYLNDVSYIPYSSVLYITETTLEHLKVVASNIDM